jgi:hypothetical protein
MVSPVFDYITFILILMLLLFRVLIKMYWCETDCKYNKNVLCMFKRNELLVFIVSKCLNYIII